MYACIKLDFFERLPHMALQRAKKPAALSSFRRFTQVVTSLNSKAMILK